jgi:uncharacterized membrane protein
MSVGKILRKKEETMVSFLFYPLGIVAIAIGILINQSGAKLNAQIALTALGIILVLYGGIIDVVHAIKSKK